MTWQRPVHSAHDRNKTAVQVTREALHAPGRPIETSVRRVMEERLGQDFSRVRVHTEPSAARSADAIDARAYAVGSDVVFARGQYAPDTPVGRRLLTHELVHVMQQPTNTKSPTHIGTTDGIYERQATQIADRVMTGQPLSTHIRSQISTSPPALMCASEEELTRRATYPTATERRQILEVLNPQQQQAVQQGTSVPDVTDPAGFRSAMTARMNQYIDRVLPGAQVRQSSTVRLGLSEIQSVGDIAQNEVRSFYGTYLRAAVHTPAEQQRRAGYRLRQHIHLVPTSQSAMTDRAAARLDCIQNAIKRVGYPW